MSSESGVDSEFGGVRLSCWVGESVGLGINFALINLSLMFLSFRYATKGGLGKILERVSLLCIRGQCVRIALLRSPW